jgi:hypothetical protein
MDSKEKFYDNRMQTSLEAIEKIAEASKNKKMLVFGLGYDSLLWNSLTDDLFFVEDNDEYINNSLIDSSKIIAHKYRDISVDSSFDLSIEQIEKYEIPNKILTNAPYDIIYIDGPVGCCSVCPGRLLPIYWSKYYLSKSGTVIFIDDSNRKLESYCISKFFPTEKKEHFNIREGLCKITIN